MKPELQRKLEAPYFDHPSLRGTPATDQQILNAQQRLGVTFHSDYIDSIKRYGGSFGGVDIHAFENGSLLGPCTVIDLTLLFREFVPQTYQLAWKAPLPSPTMVAAIQHYSAIRVKSISTCTTST